MGDRTKPLYTVAIGGHSQTPDITLPNTDISLCRLSGGKLVDFWSHATFQRMRCEPHDLSILFLGGNDIYDGCYPSEIVSDILKIGDHLKLLNKAVVITLIEPRHYAPGNRFGVSSETYERVSRSVNRKLLKLLKKRNIGVINLGARPFKLGHKSDGVHFNALTAIHVRSKFRNCVEHHMATNN